MHENSLESFEGDLLRIAPCPQHASMSCTLPETNVAPENGWLEYYFPIGEAYFQGLR